MTLFHFGNCVALAYVPYYLTYKYSGLSEYGAFWKCTTAGFMYVLTQLCKMMILATFFPSSDGSGAGMDLVHEFLKSTVDIADCVGLYFVMSRIAGKGETKVLIAGVGWATAELILTRFLPLWVGARGLEFDWKYIQMSFDSNINLIQHLGTGMLIWLWSRHDLHQSLRPLVVILLAACTYRPLLLELLNKVLGGSAWAQLGMKALLTGSLGTVALMMYIGVIQSLGIY